MTLIDSRPKLAFLPYAGMGHLIPAVEMAKRLTDRFAVTIITMTAHNPGSAATAASYIDSVTSSGVPVEFVQLPPLQGLSSDKVGLAFMSLHIEAHKPAVKSAIAGLLTTSSRVAGVFIDFFCTSMIDVANELDVPCYLYFTCNLSMLCLKLYLPTLDATIREDFSDVDARGEKFDIPGISVPMPPHLLPEHLLSKKNEAYALFVQHGERFREVRGIAVNSFTELEPVAMRAISEGRCLPHHPMPPVYPVGPVMSMGEKHDSSREDQHECISWLSTQPESSVVFLCFGSMGSFNKEQAMEMAVGLERSGHRFLWCLRSPQQGVGLAPPVDADLKEVLPEGFLERTKGWGMVWPKWAPQAEILQHPAVGGFVSHCGWNSLLESVWAGVPVLAWPLYAEQRINAVSMAKDAGMALELGVGYGGGRWRVIGAEVVEKGVRKLMGNGEEGRKVRERAMELRDMGKRALEDGDSSSQGLEKLVEQLLANKLG